MYKLIALFIGLNSLTFSQSLEKEKNQIDSLKQLIDTVDNDSLVVKALIDLDCRIYTFDRELDYDLSLRIDSISKSKISSRIPKSEKKFFLKARAFALNSLGEYYAGKDLYELSIEQHLKSLEIRKEIGDKIEISVAYNKLGVLYFKQCIYDVAIEYYAKSLKLREAVEDHKGVAMTLNNIGIVYNILEDYNNALYCYTRSLNLNKKIKDKAGIAAALNNIGITHKSKGEYIFALEHYEKALDIHKLENDKKGIAYTLNNIGSIYELQKDYHKALKYQFNSLEICDSIGDQYCMAMVYNDIGNIYLLQFNNNKSIQFCKKAMTIAKSLEVDGIVNDASFILYQNYKQLGNYRESLKMFELFDQTRDSLESEKYRNELLRKEYKYKYEKKLAEDSLKSYEESKVRDALFQAEKSINIQQREHTNLLYIGLALTLCFIGFMLNRFVITNKQKAIIENQKDQVAYALDQLEKNNRKVLNSIKYAKRIQSSMFPTRNKFKEYLKDSFIFYKPKDIVAGDFYWFSKKGCKLLFAAADCTGHGVPGALVSMVCNDALNVSVKGFSLTDPAEILEKTREIVIERFNNGIDDVQDGMDIALCSLEGNQLTYAGANNPLWIVRNGLNIVEVIKADKQPIGKFQDAFPFSSKHIELNTGDCIYIFSDGFVDQFGGKKGKKFKAKLLKELLVSIQKETMDNQKQLLEEVFEQWKLNHEQVDDVCIIGYKMP